MNFEKPESNVKIGGYAPGYYYCTCCDCEKPFMGDKRAIQCYSCAVNSQETNALNNIGNQI